MSSIVIGKSDQDKNVALDLDILIRTRLLVQANSGGGKSWLLRRFAEETFGKVPLIIIDPEGEFATLREKFGFVLVGKGGETPADPRSAALLAHKLLELRASAVCDIYELKPQVRHHWVKLFLEALVDAPKKLWRPTIVIVDEAHVYSPEKGQGESEAFSAMGDLVTRGRKRGFCAVFATQRLAKLSKNVSAEMLNRLVGQTFEDVDQYRAADLLSVPRPERTAFFEQMKVIEPGYFWALGRAIAKSRLLVRVGKVSTTHPEPGSASYSAEPPPAPAKVQALLPKLSDLPRAAEEQAKSMADLKNEIRELKGELRERNQAIDVMSKTVKVETKINQAAINKSVKQWQDRAAIEAKRHLDHGQRINKGLRDFHGQLIKLSAKIPVMIDDISGSLNSVNVSQNRASVPQNGQNVSQNSRSVSSREPAAHNPSLPPSPARAGSIRVDMDQDGTEGEKLTGPEQRIVDAIAWQNSIGIEEPDQVAVAFLAHYTYGTGGFNNAKGSLRTKGLVEYRGDRIELTDAGKKLANAAEEDLTTEELHKRVLSVLKNPEQRILKPLLEAYPKALHDEELAPLAKYKPGVGGFNNPKGRLRTLGLIQYPQPRHSVASKILFLD
jgi:hypothetical protein